MTSDKAANVTPGSGLCVDLHDHLPPSDFDDLLLLFWKIDFTLKAKNLENRELQADTSDRQRNNQKQLLCPWLPSLPIPPSQDFRAVHPSPQKTEGYLNVLVQFPLLFVHFYR